MLADEECQILKHSQQWVETIDPSVIAMQALFQSTNQGHSSLFESLAANLSTLTKLHQSSGRDKRGESDSSLDRRFHYDTPDWVYNLPEDASQKKVYQGKTWHFCTKCGRHGKWVCTHTDATHHPRDEYLCDHRGRDWFRQGTSNHDRDRRSKDYGRSQSRTPPSTRDSSYMHHRSRAVTFQHTHLMPIQKRSFPCLTRFMPLQTILTDACLVSCCFL